MPGRSILIGFIPLLLTTQVPFAPTTAVPVEPRRAFLTRALAVPPEAGSMEPLGLASADLDEDGMPDLVSVHGSAGGSLLVIRFGNVDSIHPNSPDARRRMEEGTFHEGPFLPGSRVFAAPGRADFIATGDFDADGHMDILTAGSGGDQLQLHAGDGRGSLAESRNLTLPGLVTVLAAGEVNRADGLADLVIGIDGEEGLAALVLEGPSGAFEAEPESVPLPARAERIRFARLDDDVAIDVTVETLGPRVVIHGRDRTSADPGEAVAEILPGEDFETRSPDDRSPREATGLLNPGDAGTPVAVLTMRLNRDAIPDRVILTRTGLTTEMSAPAATFTVTSAADDGAGSLREAIAMANANAGPDWIVFDIPGPGPHTIEPLMPLPEITDPVTIDGTTQPGFQGNPVIELSGAEAGPDASGLVVTGGSSVIRGLVVNRFGGGPFESAGVVLKSSNSIVEGNFIGSDPSGSLPEGNVTGVLVDLSDNLVGGTTPFARNVISGNEEMGLVILGPGPSRVQGNFIGTDVTGRQAVPNPVGLHVNDRTVIGGTERGAGNLISGNEVGLFIIKGDGNLVQGNLIGTDALGMSPIENRMGVSIGATNATTVGATTPAGLNVISGNLWGMSVFGSESVLIQGNYIGTDTAGTGLLANGIGIEFHSVEFSMVGGAGEGAGNIISGNGFGIWVEGSPSNTVQGNYFGTDTSGTTGLGNEVAVVFWSGDENLVLGNLFCDNQIGIALRGGDHTRIQENVMGLTPAGEPLLNHRAIEINGGNGNLIGGDDVEDGNTIAHNHYGVIVEGGTGNTIRSNSMHSNLFSIYLQGRSSRDNDYHDGDQGPNDLQNFPAFFDNACGDARGVLQSERLREFTLDFYASDRCYPGYTEGKTPLGSMKVTTDDLADALFSFPIPPEVAPGQFITATATNDRGSTSEFSECALVLPPDCARPVARVATTVFECTDNGRGLVTWDASPSTDANSTPGTNEDIVSFEWFYIFEDLPNRGAPISRGEVVEAGLFPLGKFQYPFVLLVTDSTGLVDYLLFDIEVVDTTPPVVDVPMEPALLWPPNHRMVEVSALLDDRDVCTSSTSRLVSVSSSELDDDAGGADGTTVDDIQDVVVGTRDVDFLLRAERSGGGEGRAYTLTYESADEHGNSTLTTAMVLVPHDMGGVTEPLILDVDHSDEGTVVSWDEVPGAIHYNIVQGDVGNMKRSSKSFHMGSLECLASGTAATSVRTTADPDPGQTLFYLVEYDDGLPSGFGTESAALDRFVPAGQACP